MDAVGDLFVANDQGQTVMENFFTGPGKFGDISPSFLSAGNTFGPIALAFGLAAPPAVPEAPTTVSLGLLLLLGFCGVVVAALKKRPA